MSQSGLLELAHEKLHWPTPKQILDPSGAGPSIYARMAKEKLGRAISKLPEGDGVQVGVLSANPEGDSTEAPIAVVCDFQQKVSETTLRDTYKLVWNFSRTPSLVTAEPDRLRIWTCYEEPPTTSDIIRPVVEVFRWELESLNEPSLSQQAADTLRLHWVDLVSGQFFQQHHQRFQRSCAADLMLLSNLKSVRQQLQRCELDEGTIHDLLARIIFIQFLFDRKDSQGNPALDAKLLTYLHRTGELSDAFSNLTEILRNYRDTYKFFRWLNNKFNGDLFPGKGVTEEKREAEWQIEKTKVTQHHLNLLAEFVSGDLEMARGQRCLWPYYRFDVIPLDFISSIYEEFVSKESGTGVHYTPEHIVDFILDGVLPWNSQEWDVRILDPACGSGIFLVKAFQRLIYRWEQAHPNKTIQPSILKSLLENNLFGVDVDSQAVRVASFSLYLTMLDKIEPQYYWENEFRFPRLRERQLINADFFEENREGFRSHTDAGRYDLVVGNAPWGKNTVTQAAKTWAGSEWKITYGNIGPLFLAKAAALTKPGGQVTMMQPALALIFNQVSTAKEFRTKLFSTYKVEEIVNLSTLRFGLFKDAISPACVITLSVTPPDSQPLIYICPKPVFNNEDDYHIVVEPHDIHTIYPREAIEDPFIWTALMWGGRRDLSLIKRLCQELSIEKLIASGRFASYIPEVNVDELLRVPIPQSQIGALQNIKDIDELDECIRQAFEFKDSEWVLINDLFNYTLPDFKGDSSSPGRQKTHRRDKKTSKNHTEPELTLYCEYFLRVLKAGFGQDKQVCATIFQEQGSTHLPIRLVAIYLNRPDCEGVHIKSIDSSNLLEQLEKLNQLCVEKGDAENGGIFYQRVAKVYDSVQVNGIKVPTIYLIKPDKIRYWTRSIALRDADEVVANIMMLRKTFDKKSEVIQES